MRIAHFIATNFLGGPERQILNHISRLPRPGHTALLLSFDEPGGRALCEAASALGVECRLLPSGKWRILNVARQLVRLYDDWQPDVVCAHGYKAGFYGLILKLWRDCRVVGFSRGWTSEGFAIWLYGLLDRLVIRFADVVIAVSHSQREKLLRARVPARKIRVVENAVTIPADAIQARVVGDVRRELGLSPEAKIVLAAGRLSPEKAYDDLLQAMELVVRDSPQAHLLLAGAGPREQSLKDQAATLSCGAHIHFLGFRPDVRGLFRQADVFALSSVSEGLPNVVLEAMALGVPVVATRVGGIPDIIDDGNTGLLVASRAPVGLACALNRFLGDPEFSRQTGERARAAVYERLDPGRQTELLLQSYKEAMRR